MRKMMKQALYAPISEVYYCDHVMDNTFVRSRLYETEWQLEDRGYIPIGYCAEPEYSPSSGVAFVLKDKDDNTFWVHVPKPLFRSWLRELQLDWKEHPIWKKDVVKAVKLMRDRLIEKLNGGYVYCRVGGFSQLLKGIVKHITIYGHDCFSFGVAIHGYFVQNYTNKDVGKNVFLSEEEAEQALQKRGAEQ